MYAPRPEPRPLTPLADLLTDALLLCYRRPLPFVAAAAAGAFVPAFLGWLLAPETGPALSLWRVGESALAVGLVAPTLYLIARANRGESPSVGAAVAGLLAFGPRLFVIGLVVGVAAAPLAFPFDTALPADPEPSGKRLDLPPACGQPRRYMKRALGYNFGIPLRFLQDMPCRVLAKPPPHPVLKIEELTFPTGCRR